MFQDDIMRIDTSSHTENRKFTIDNSTLWCYRNDYAYLRFYAEKDGSISIESCCNDSTKSELSITLLKECAVKAFIGHGGWHFQNKREKMPKGERISVNDYLSECDGSVKNGDTVWFRIFASADCGGDYSVKVSFNGTQSVYTLHVLNRILPSPENYLFDTEYWIHPYNSAEYYGVEPFEAEHLEILKLQQELYKSLGGKNVTATIVEDAWGGQTYSKNEIHYPSMIKWIKKCDGSFEYDYSHFDKWVKLNRSLGLNKIVCYSPMIWGNKLIYFDTLSKKYKSKKLHPVDSTYKKFFDAFLTDFIKHLDDNNWFDDTYLAFDERHNIEKLIDYLSEFKNKDSHTFGFSGAFNRFKEDRSCFNKLTKAAVSMSVAAPSKQDFVKITEERKALGKKTAVYTGGGDFPNSMSLNMPGESYITIMRAASLNADGYLRWAFDAWNLDPLKDTTHWSFPAGDCFLVFPSKEKKPQFSIRLLKLDEGIRDANKLLMLKNEGKENEVNRIFDSLKTYTSYAVNGRKFGRQCHTAHWASEETEKELPKDMAEIKEAIYRLSVE